MAQLPEFMKHADSYHPSSLKTRTYDAIAIGSGWATRPMGARLVKAGYTFLVIDNELLGGDCPFWACVPSKALLRPSEALEAAKQVGGAREQLKSATVDVEGVFARRNAFTGGWDDEALLAPMIRDSGTDIARGTAKVIGEKKVAITSLNGEVFEFSAKHAVVIGTGSVPIIPNIPGLQEARPWTPREATSASKVPEHLVVLGAGAVGCEMATVFHSLGSRVTIISSTPEILANVDPEAGEIVRKRYTSQGVEVLTSTKATKVERGGDGHVKIETSTGKTITASEILIATGRRARTDGCGLETLGLPTDGTPIEVEESLRVKAVAGGWLYAVGDVNGRSPLTHMCKYQARIASNAIIAQIKGNSASNVAWGPASATADLEAIPRVMFTQPTVAAVGLTRTSAERLKKDVRIITAASASVGSFLHSDTYMREPGWAQWVVDSKSNQLLGMTVVGEDAQDLIHAATVAVAGGVTLDRLAHAVPCFPTMSEVYLNLADAAGL